MNCLGTFPAMSLIVAGLAGCGPKPDLRKEPVGIPVARAAQRPSLRSCDALDQADDKLRCHIDAYFSAPACAHAFHRLATTYRYRKGRQAYPIHQLVNACARAYCPRLKAPRPAFCAAPAASEDPTTTFHRAPQLAEAIDAVEGGRLAWTLLSRRAEFGYCRVDRAPGTPAKRVTLRLRQTGNQVTLRASGAVQGEWRFSPPKNLEPYRPLIAALHRARFTGTPRLIVESTVSLWAVVFTRSALRWAGWCHTSSPKPTSASPGGVRCPGRGATALEAPFPYPAKAPPGLNEGLMTLRVSANALFYKNRPVVELVDGRVPAKFLTDFEGGYLIHPLRLAFQRDLPRQLLVVVDPGVILSDYLAASISHTAYQAWARVRHSPPPVPLQLRCR